MKLSFVPPGVFWLSVAVLPLLRVFGEEKVVETAVTDSTATASAAGPVEKLRLGVVPGAMQFSPKVLSVKAGAQVKLLFENSKDPQSHNFVLVNPGKLVTVGELADRLVQTDPAGALRRNYVPVSPEILASGTKMVGIAQTELIQFTAPAHPGDYPFVCTFPGHWRLMNGVLKVIP